MIVIIRGRPFDLGKYGPTERVRVMVLNVNFNDISVISWRSVLSVEEIGVPGENHRPASSHCEGLSHNVVSSTSCLFIHEWVTNNGMISEWVLTVENCEK